MFFDFITIGGATEDITFYTDEGILTDNKSDVLRQKLLSFEYGAKIEINKAYSTYGGGAANAAVCLARLGYKTACLAAIGDDFRGKSLMANFKNNGVMTNLLKKIKGEKTGYSFFLVGRDNEHICFSDRAANQKLKIEIRDVKILKQAREIYLTSLSGDWRGVLNKIFSSRRTGITWNPGQLQLKSGFSIIGKFFKYCQSLIVNQDEAIELVISDKKYRRQDRGFLNNIRNLLAIIKKWGPQIVIITASKRGADAYDGVKFYHHEIVKEKRFINTTGVGDAFGSTFTAGLEMFKGDIKKAMQLGVTNTASVVANMGAQAGLLTKKEIFRTFH